VSKEDFSERYLRTSMQALADRIDYDIARCYNNVTPADATRFYLNSLTRRYYA